MSVALRGRWEEGSTHHEAVINDLAAHGPSSACQIARRVGISDEAARNHLAEARALGNAALLSRGRHARWDLT